MGIPINFFLIVDAIVALCCDEVIKIEIFVIVFNHSSCLSTLSHPLTRNTDPASVSDVD